MTSTDVKTASQNTIHQRVKDYYGKVLTGINDVASDVCSIGKDDMPQYVIDTLSLIHPDVKNKYYGCGTLLPECTEGKSVLDLGSGSGQDCYVLSKMVGENGSVVGIDMTDEQVETSTKYIGYHTEMFGFLKPNVKFVKGYIENLYDAGIQENSFDIIVSNGVINLCPDKKTVFKEAYRVLKDGGEMFFSDVYADRDLPAHIRTHEFLWGECIAGALWWEDLDKITCEIGFTKPLLVSACRFRITNERFQEVLGDARFVAATYRLFKIPPKIQMPCEIMYNGTIPRHEDEIKFDERYHFKKDDVKPVSGAIGSIITSSRFSEHFTVCDDSNEKSAMDPFRLAEKTKRTTCCRGPKPC